MHWYIISDVGCKNHQTVGEHTPKYVSTSGYRMEDAHAVLETANGIVMCIADGHGSIQHAPSVHLGGQECAENAVNFAVNEKTALRKNPTKLFIDMQNYVREKISKLNTPWSASYIDEHANLVVSKASGKSEKCSLGATVSCLRVSKKHGIMCASIGDTAAILIHADGTYEKLTENHNRENAQELKRVTTLGAKKVGKSYMGYKYKNGEEYFTQITRAIGHFGNNAIIQTPHCVTTKVRSGDVVVMATDGLWDYMTIDAVVKCCVGQGKKSVQSICQTLLDESIRLCPTKKKNKRDNVTIGVIDVAPSAFLSRIINKPKLSTSSHSFR